MGILDVLGRITDLIAKLVDLVRSANKKVLFSITAVVALVAFSALGYFVGRYDPTSKPNSGTSLPPAPARVGGLDLATYCKSYSYTENNLEFCSAPIKMDDACNWQYRRNDLRLEFGSSAPESGKCYDPKNVHVGGIKDMTGYCRNTFQGSIDVVAIVLNEKTWTCQTKIDMNLACEWQYQRDQMKAREETKGIWGCYE
jgi:hypothetical protein